MIVFVIGIIGNEIKFYLEDLMLSLFIFIILNFILGWYVIVLEKDVINVFLLVEDVFKVLIFGGIVNFSVLIEIS